MVVAGAVVIAGGIGVAVVEMLHFPKGSIWLVVAVTAVAASLIRALSRRRGR